MSIEEQISIIEKDCCGEMQEAVENLCLYALCIFLGTLLVGWIVKKLMPAIKWAKRNKAKAVLAIPFVMEAMYLGATKTGKVDFPFTDTEKRYLYDAGSYVTNDYVHVAWTRSPIVPATADFWGAVRPVGSTNDEEWVIFYEETFETATSPMDIWYIGAQTNDFQFFTTWTPGPTVHTNGVATIVWQKGSEKVNGKIVPYRTGIYKGAIRVGPSGAITNGPSINEELKTIAEEEE